MEKTYKISQATLTTPYKSNHLNVLMAPIGSGKTYYFGGKFIRDISMPKNKALIFLAPLKAIVSQANATDRMEAMDNQTEHLLKGFTIFDNDSIEDISPKSLANKKIAMTAQKFSHLIGKNPEIKQYVGAVVLDEFDAIISNYANLDKAQNKKYGLHKLIPTLYNLSKENIKIVLTSATISEYAKKYLSKFPISEIKFREKLEELKPNKIVYFDNKKYITKSKKKTAVYMSRVDSLIQLKNQLQSQGYIVALLKSHSSSNDKYTMTEYDEYVLKDILENAKVPDNLDFLLFNKAYERGVSIEKPQFDRIYVWSTNQIVQFQSAGRFRYDDIEWWFKGENAIGEELEENKNENIIGEYVGEFLNKEKKNELCQKLNWRNGDRSLMKWKKVKEELESMGYSIKEQRKNKQRVSVIEKS